MEMLNDAATMAGEHIPKQGWVQSIATWGMGYFGAASPKADDVTEEELSWWFSSVSSCQWPTLGSVTLFLYYGNVMYIE